MKDKITLSIISVYFGEIERLRSLLISIKKSGIKYPYEVIIVNNKPKEHLNTSSFAKIKNINIINSSGNIGYGRGNNLGIKSSRAKYVFVVNPDTKLIKGSLNDLIAILEKNKNVAVVAPNLIDTNGYLFEKQGTRVLTPLRAVFSLTILSKIFPNNKYFRDYYMLDLAKDKLREVDTVPGSAFLIRKDLFDNIGGFDRTFFLFFEETDLCLKIIKTGKKILMTPDVAFEHDWKPNEGGQKLKKIFKQSRFYYFKKNFGLLDALIVEFFAGISKYDLIFILIIAALIIFKIFGLY
jgi:GT2 family glycosyltransferase